MRAGTVQPVSDSPTVVLVFSARFVFCDSCDSLFALVFLVGLFAIVIFTECVLFADCWCCFVVAHSVVVLIFNCLCDLFAIVMVGGSV